MHITSRWRDVSSRVVHYGSECYGVIGAWQKRVAVSRAGDSIGGQGANFFRKTEKIGDCTYLQRQSNMLDVMT